MEVCTHDACLPVKKTILGTKKILEEIFEQLKKDYPTLTIEETYSKQGEDIIPKIGIFPSSIARIDIDEKITQPLKIMIFINVLNAKEKEVELTAGWICGPGAEKETDETYVKLLDVVFLLKQQKGAIYKGKLEKEPIQKSVKVFIEELFKEYKEVLASLEI